MNCRRRRSLSDLQTSAPVSLTAVLILISSMLLPPSNIMSLIRFTAFVESCNILDSSIICYHIIYITAIYSLIFCIISYDCTIIYHLFVYIHIFNHKKRVQNQDRKSTRLNSSHTLASRMPSSA